MLAKLFFVTELRFKRECKSQYGINVMLKRLRPLMLALGLAFMIVLLMHSWDELKLRFSTLIMPLFILSVVVATAGNFSTSMFFQFLLNKYGARINGQLSHQIFFYGQIAKYIPGKIWGIIYQSMMLQSQGTTSGVVFANLDLVVMQITMCAFIALTLLVVTTSLVPGIAFLVAGLVVCVLLTRSCIFFKLISVIPVYSKLRCTCKPNDALVGVVGYYFIFGATYFGGHFLMLMSVFDFTANESLTYVAFLGLSWIIGVVTLISPAGLGIRELVFLSLAQTVSSDVSLDTIAAIAVVARFWLIMQELLGVSLIALYKVYRKRSVIDVVP